LDVRRNDEGLGKRSRWAFFISLLIDLCRFHQAGLFVDSAFVPYSSKQDLKTEGMFSQMLFWNASEVQR
jgi:hypothetical protein